MKLFYITILILIFTSCGPAISYIGSSSTPTTKIEIIVDESAIEKPYKIVGKGYYNFGTTFYTKEEMVKFATTKAKQIGADAIWLKDYYTYNTGTIVTETSRIDTVNKGVIYTNKTNVTPNSPIV